jgi:hypothetical protein
VPDNPQPLRYRSGSLDLVRVTLSVADRQRKQTKSVGARDCRSGVRIKTAAQQHYGIGHGSIGIC